MKINKPSSSSIALMLTLIIFLFDVFYPSNSTTSKQITSQVFRRDSAQAIIDTWGQMDIYTSGDTETFGTQNMFTALTDVLPGKSVHPSHRHGEEEFLVITRGTGIWSLKGESIPAKTGDMIYADPWDFHGLVNTGSDTLTFFVIKWKNKLIDIPAEPEGNHGK